MVPDAEIDGAILAQCNAQIGQHGVRTVRVWYAHSDALFTDAGFVRGRWMDHAAVPKHPAERTPCARFGDPLAFV